MKRACKTSASECRRMLMSDNGAGGKAEGSRAGEQTGIAKAAASNPAAGDGAASGEGRPGVKRESALHLHASTTPSARPAGAPSPTPVGRAQSQHARPVCFLWANHRPSPTSPTLPGRQACLVSVCIMGEVGRRDASSLAWHGMTWLSDACLSCDLIGPDLT